MKKLFTILITLTLLCAVGCEEQGNDNVNPNEKPDIENPEDKPDDQIPDDAYIIINKELVTFSPDGESVDIKVYSNYEWKLTNNCDWVTTSVAGGEASDTGTTVTLTAALTYDNHEGTITFSCGKAKKLLVVSQSLKETIIADGNNTFSVPAKGGKVIINYQTSVECEVVIPEESKSWISITPATRALVSESATLTVKENTSYSERNAVVKVVKVGDNTLSAKYTISQKPADKPSVSDTPLADIPCAANEILYTTKYDLPIELGNTQGFGGNLVYNTYENGIGRLTFGNDVTAIPEKAFYNCNSMESIKLPDGIKSVGAYAFRNCSSLTTFCGKLASEDGACLIVNGVLEAFAFGSGRTEYIIPDGVTEIGENAFRDCTSLTSATIPDSVTSIGGAAFYGCTSLNSITIPDSVTTIGYSAFFCCTSLTSVTIGNGVTSIESCAFQNCTSLAKINIPNSVTSIDTYAFLYCTGELTIDNKWLIENNTKLAQTSGFDRVNFSSIVIGENITKIGNDVFSGFSSLTSVTIPDSVTEIGNGAFDYCSSLTSITIPDSVTSIGNYAFSDCTSLTSITIPDSVTKIGGHAFSYCSSLTSVTIPDSVTEIGSDAFYNCTSLTSITIPDSVTSIGSYAFGGCSSLTNVTIGKGVKSIGDDAFQGCTGELTVNCNIPDGRLVNLKYYGVFSSSKFTKVTIGNGVTKIGNYAFKGCTSLTSVTIPDGVTSIGDYAFYGCSSLTSITIPNSVTSIRECAFYNCSSLKSITIPNSVTSIRECAFYNCSSLKSITIPDSVTSIGESAFSGCSSLTSVTIPDSVTSIGDSAFYFCYSLTSISIPDSVTSIGDDAFCYCTSLTSVTIPDGVTEIGENAFNCCYSLTSVYCKPTTPPSGASRMFYNNASGRKIYVPTESVETYKTAEEWRVYAADIVGYNFGGGENTTTPPANEIWYTNGSTTEPTTPNKTDVFGATYVYNTYDAEKGCWVIKFDGDVTSIGNFAFYGYTSLTSITIPDSVTSIGSYAFQNCTSLTSVTIPDGVTSIGDNAFFYCTSLTSITIPDSVTEIGDYAFYNCTSLTSFHGKFASEDGKCLIVDSVLNAFAIGCNISEYTIPDGVTSIGDYAFYFCYSLTSVTIPDSVASIGNFAFSDCSSLTSVTIPDSVTSIGMYAFYGCTSLTNVYCKATTPPSGNSSMFYNNASGRKIYVPTESVEAYKAAQYWSDYATDIVGYNF